ncbi:MAG: hypothetical protein J5958_03765 [Clostridia bacterium]|nr:hypothetical protein [Clostridia bacterium]
MNARKKSLSLLLVLAMLIASAAMLLPITSSATEPEIDDFGVQTLTALDLPNDANTVLRFVFTIGNLDYEEVGVIVSKSVETPTYDAEHCFTKKMTTVYSSITADSNTEPAPDGRWWVAVKLTGIPHSYFDGPLYVRAFVKNESEDPTYSDTETVTVCSAAGHTHEGLLLCTHCDGCNLDVEPQPAVKKCNDSSKSGEKEYIPEEFIIRSVQGYDADNPDPANDLLMEFSILWNPTMLNLDGEVEGSEGPYCATRIMGGGTSNLTYWSGTNDPKGSWCPYAGGFEGAKVTKGGPAGMLKNHGDYSDYPNIGGTVAAADANNLENGHEWGWHRVGVRVHQEVRNLAALMEDTTPGATAPTYRTTVTVYFDGEEVFSVYGDNKLAGHYLYTVASNGDGTVTYTPIADDVKAIPFALHSRRVKSDTAAYVVTADISVTCGTEFVQDVERVNAPAGNPTYTVAAGVNVPAKMYFKLAD